MDVEFHIAHIIHHAILSYFRFITHFFFEEAREYLFDARLFLISSTESCSLTSFDMSAQSLKSHFLKDSKLLAKMIQIYFFPVFIFQNVRSVHFELFSQFIKTLQTIIFYFGLFRFGQIQVHFLEINHLREQLMKHLSSTAQGFQQGGSNEEFTNIFNNLMSKYTTITQNQRNAEDEKRELFNSNKEKVEQQNKELLSLRRDNENILKKIKMKEADLLISMKEDLPLLHPIKKKNKENNLKPQGETAPITDRKNKTDGIYLAPEVLKGGGTSLKSVFFILAVIWDELIHYESYFKSIEQIENLAYEYKVRETSLNPILRNTLFQMMSKEPNKGLELGQAKCRLSLQRYIVSQSRARTTTSRVSTQSRRNL